MTQQRTNRILSIVLLSITPAVSGAVMAAETYTKHVVAAQERHAADVGRDAMRRGGNAIDAAVATAFTLAVTLPEAGNLGGGGFIVAYLADRHEVVTIDFREVAPATSEPRMYLDREGKTRPRYRAGAWSAGVPGTVRGLGLAHARFGKTPWPELVRPAARLARQGFSISADLAGSLNRQLAPHSPEATPGRPRDDFGTLGDFPESINAFGRTDRKPWREGDTLIQTDLAQTLDRIAEVGPDEFFSGRTAQLIVRYMVEHGGFVTLDDLKSYQAKLRPPVRTSFRGFDVFSIGPPSGGGVALCQMLNILERFDLKADGRDSPRTLHRITEAMRRAFYTRATQLADPDFVEIKVDELTSKAHADKLARAIGAKATPSQDLAPFKIQGVESDHTTHLSSLDEAGNAVALTYTLEDSYGAKCVVTGAGFLLNNEMGDFNLVPGLTDISGRVGTPANLIGPYKRMLSSQTPTLLLKGGRVRVVTGSPGGRTIPNTVLWVVLNLVEFGMDPAAAVAAPRTHHQWFPDTLVLEGRTWAESTRMALARLGHKLTMRAGQGTANTIVVDDDGRLHGVADHRRTTSTASGD